MSKISLILQREYLSRVRKKSFIIMTLLGPVLFAAMMVVPTWLSSMEDSIEKKVAIVDHTGLYIDQIKDTDLLKFEYLEPESEEDLRNNFSSTPYYAYLVISEDLLENPDAIRLYSDGQITMDVRDHITGGLREYLRSQKLKSFELEGLDGIIAAINKVGIQLTTIKLGEDGSEKESSTEMAMVVSLVFAFLTYMFVFIYGTQVLRGVMEEKTSRIVEVIISSVKPFQLMLGKIIGIAMVALTQVFLWILLTVLIVTGAKALFFSDTDMPSRMDGIEMAMEGSSQQAQAAQADGFNFDKVMDMVNSMNPVTTILLFILYFLGGYLIYASLFAAVGAAIDNETDSQQFMFPITIPIIIALYVAMAAFRNPHSDLVFWFSMIPFTSPVVMMARIPFDVPIWQIALSLTLLIAGFLFTTWFAARIYRTGILMYGKKVNYKELWKWFRYSDK
ncbi:ABC transporter permease [Geofilum rubicundum]|uniref:Membrane protein n=1 Tax=Geofilum rubicundum JCM 15548 TaxID=1236989 RepID=A0A0E9LU55_9BACT|nr:ABC transporter permease [Geofilum rubicundum]GAO29107.1 membrane protein [Geofilum rubicundum JCM 15548]